MKKFLLSAFAALACVATASADEATFTFTGEGDAYGLTRTSDNNANYYQTGTVLKEGAVEIAILGDGDSSKEYGNGVRLWTDGLRVMKKSGFTITAGTANITNIVITTTKNNGPASFDVNTTESFTVNTTNTKEGTWDGSAASVKLINNATKGLKGTVGITTIKVTYSEGGVADTRKDADLEFSDAKVSVVLGEAFTEPQLTKATTAPVTFASDKETVATVDATTGKVTIIAAGTARITATAEANDEYKAGSASYLLTVTKPVELTTVELATAMSDGKFAIHTAEGVAKNYTGSNAYGYLYLESVTVADNMFEVNKDYLIEFTNTDKGYTMKDCKGNFLGMDATHFGSFNFYDSADAEGSNCYWTVTFNGNDVKIENVGRTGAYISYQQYKNDWEIVTTDKADKPLVNLYKEKGTSAIESVVVDENAPVEYFNLQGVRVANPENGLYIRRQGNTVTKVIVK